MYEYTMSVTVKADRVIDHHDGTFTVEVSARQVSGTEHEVLTALFPDLGQAVDLLLMKQALLSSIK